MIQKSKYSSTQNQIKQQKSISMTNSIQLINMGESQIINQNIRQHLDKLQKDYQEINQDITVSNKLFDEVLTEDKDSYQKIRRNLDDVKIIFVKEFDKFQENVDKSVQFNQALYNRLEKDLYYLRDDQENLHQKMLHMEKRILDMEEQIGSEV